MLTITNGSKQYGTTEALVPVSLDVTTGDTLVPTGPSGYGKSTLLRLIAAHIQPVNYIS